MVSSRVFKGLFFALGAACFLFILVPIGNLFISLELPELKETLKDAEVWQAIGVTLQGAALSTAVGLTLGVPAAYLLSEAEFKGKHLIEGAVNIPIVIPHVAVGIILLKLLNTNSPLGELLSKLGITFVDTLYGIVVAMCFVSISYIIASALLGFKSVNRELLWTARSLGASPFQTFKLILLPLSLSHIIRGAVLSFARAVSEVGALLIIAYYPKTAPILMYERFENYGLKASTPIAALVILISLLIFTILLSIPTREER